MNIDSFSRSNNYYFEIIPKELGYFAKKSYINRKLEFISQNFLVYLSENKLLYVILDDNEEKWLPYEKAIFFFEHCGLNDKYILLIENESFYYGFIDGFPCVFTSDFESARDLMMEYSNGEFVKIVGVGCVERKCHFRIKYDDILISERIDDPLKVDYLREENFEYEELKNFDNLFFIWYKKNEEMRKKKWFFKCCFLICLIILFSFFA